MNSLNTLNNDSVECMVCGIFMKKITNTHLKRHNISSEEYKIKFPESDLTSLSTKNKHSISKIGKKFSEELKKKLSQINKGKIISEKTRVKISNTLKGIKRTEEYKQKLKDYYKTHKHAFKGKKHSDESKRRISETGKGRIPWNKGKICPKDVREKISKKLKGRVLPIETRKKMSLSQKGKIIKEETKIKLSKAHKGKKHTQEHIINFLKSVHKSPNKFEKKCIELFKKNDIPLEFVGDFKNQSFFIDGKVPDFISTNGKKVVVEVFYEYFKKERFGSVEKYKINRADTFLRHGWKTLFFTYEEINSNFDKCLNTLKEELK